MSAQSFSEDIPVRFVIWSRPYLCDLLCVGWSLSDFVFFLSLWQSAWTAACSRPSLCLLRCVSPLAPDETISREMERCVQRRVLSCYASCTNPSLPTSSSSSSSPSFTHPSTRERRARRAGQRCDKLCIRVSPPSLKRRKSQAEIKPFSVPQRRMGEVFMLVLRRKGSNQIRGWKCDPQSQRWNNILAFIIKLWWMDHKDVQNFLF